MEGRARHVEGDHGLQLPRLARERAPAPADGRHRRGLRAVERHRERHHHARPAVQGARPRRLGGGRTAGAAPAQARQVTQAHARIHAFEPRSRANGPGARFVVWFQGCTLGCPGCFNPTTHDAAAGRSIALDELIGELGRVHGIEGLSLSGGEPLQQPGAARALLDAARALGLSTLAFSGYTVEEIRDLPGGPDVLARLDVLIDGRYVAGERLATGLRGSANQRIQLLTGRYTRADVEATPVAEIRIAPTGDVILTGVDPLKLRRRP
ncbi:MAG: radical SAM protein [Deltaproteobacteria bacterium]|nr:MAG: radical SAM protein [Deltaproteobacteria bacterium]